jgi:hypothetical protein
MTSRKTGNVVEQQRWRGALGLARDDLGEAAHFELPGRAAHDLELAQLLRLFKPISQIHAGCE